MAAAMVPGSARPPDLPLPSQADTYAAAILSPSGLPSPLAVPISSFKGSATMPELDTPPLGSFPPLPVPQRLPAAGAVAASSLPVSQNASVSSAMQQSFAAALKPSTARPDFSTHLIAPVTTYKGETAVVLPSVSVEYGKSPLQYTLVGKFYSAKPAMIRIRQMFNRLDLKASYTIGSFDEVNIIIKLSCIEDYQRMVGKDWFVAKNTAFHTSRWTAAFDREKDSPVVPVWVSMPYLPLHYFNAHVLSCITAAIGRVLRIDAATLNLTRPNVARVCVELDLLKPLQKRIWIAEGDKENGFFQRLEFDDLPKYCVGCFRLGHDVRSCKRNGAVVEGLPAAMPVPKAANKTVAVYRAVRTVEEGPRGTLPNMQNFVKEVEVNAPEPLLIKDSLQNGSIPVAVDVAAANVVNKMNVSAKKVEENAPSKQPNQVIDRLDSVAVSDTGSEQQVVMPGSEIFSARGNEEQAGSVLADSGSEQQAGGSKQQTPRASARPRAVNGLVAENVSAPDLGSAHFHALPGIAPAPNSVPVDVHNFFGALLEEEAQDSDGESEDVLLQNGSDVLGVKDSDVSTNSTDLAVTSVPVIDDMPGPEQQIANSVVVEADIRADEADSDRTEEVVDVEVAGEAWSNDARTDEAANDRPDEADYKVADAATCSQKARFIRVAARGRPRGSKYKGVPTLAIRSSLRRQKLSIDDASLKDGEP